MNNNIFSLLILSIFLASCVTRIDIDDVPFVSKPVINSFICHNDSVMVFISNSYSTRSTTKEQEYVVKKAFITNSKKDTFELYVPNYSISTFKYYTTDLIPEIGEKYKLLIINNIDDSIKSETFIPEPNTIDSSYYSFISDKYNNQILQLGISFIDQFKKDYYMFKFDIYSGNSVPDYPTIQSYEFDYNGYRFNKKSNGTIHY